MCCVGMKVDWFSSLLLRTNWVALWSSILARVVSVCVAILCLFKLNNNISDSVSTPPSCFLHLKTMLFYQILPVIAVVGDIHDLFPIILIFYGFNVLFQQLKQPVKL